MNPWLKMALEVGPLVLFFGAFQVFKGAPVVIAGREYEGVVMATAVFIPAILVALAVSWIKTRHLPRMSVVTAAVVVIFGGLTLALNDEVFIKMKPTIVNLIFAAGLGWGLLRGRSYLKDLMGDALAMDDAGWIILTRRWAVFFLFLAALNEAVWRTQTEAVWVTFKTFANPALTFAFVMSQIGVLKRHGPDGD